MRSSRAVGLFSVVLLAGCFRFGFGAAEDSQPAADLSVPDGDGAVDSEVGAWLALGESLDPLGINQRETVALTVAATEASNGDVLVAWSDDHLVERHVFLRRWSAGSWTDLGGSSSTPISQNMADTTARLGSVAVDSDDTVYVAWMEDSAATRAIRLAKWSGSAWVPLAGDNTFVAGGSPWWPSITTTGEHVWVAYEGYNPPGLYVLRHQRLGPGGATWQGVAGSDAPGGIAVGSGAHFAKIAATPDAVHVIWLEGTLEASTVYHRMLPLGVETPGWSPAVALGTAQRAALYASGDTVLCAWADSAKTLNAISVATRQDANWRILAETNGPASSLTSAKTPSVGLFGEHPAVTFTYRKVGDDFDSVYFSTFDGERWSGQDLELDSNHAEFPNLVSSENSVTVVWEAHRSTTSVQTLAARRSIQ